MGRHCKDSHIGRLAREFEIVYFHDRLVYISALFAPMPMARAQERGHSNVRITRRDLLHSGLALSASSLLARSAWGRAAAMMSADSGAASAEALAAVAPREHLLFDFGWKFTFGNGGDPAKDLGFGFGQGDFAKTGEFEFAKAKFDDSKWRTLNLPHDWAVELPFVRDDEQASHGFKPLGRRYPETSVGWYRREFDIPESDNGRRIWIEFDGAFRDVLVFVNGCFIGRNDNGYAPFPIRSHGLSGLWQEELHRRARGRELRRRMVLRGRRHLPPRVADQDRRAAPGQVGELCPARA